MPPKTKTDRSMILNAAFELVKENGEMNLNARTIAQRLGCSTQPVLYHYKTVQEIRDAVYDKADEYHSNYLMKIEEGTTDPMRAIGLNYIRFAYEEKHLFRFLFQSDHFAGSGMTNLVEDERLKPIMEIVRGKLQCDEETAKIAFLSMFAKVHGIASLLANNAMIYDEKQICKILG